MQNKVIESHRAAFMKVLEFCTIKRARKYLKRELKHNQDKKSSAFALMRAATARENCYRKLLAALDSQESRESIEFDFDQDPVAEPLLSAHPGLRASSLAVLKDYLELTVFSIETLLKWRSQLEKHLRRDKIHKYHVRYEAEGENYLLRVKRDGQELCRRLGLDTRDVFCAGLGLLEPVKLRGWYAFPNAARSSCWRRSCSRTLSDLRLELLASVGR